MTTSEMFKEFLSNLAVDNAATIGIRYGEITSSLNKKFRNTESKSDNTLQVGSYGRWTGIKGISDLDMLYIMPSNLWDTYKNNQSKLLNDIKDAIKVRYPNTEIKVDRLVVQVIYTNFMVEVQPVFSRKDGGFYYPDTYNGGSWKVTKPREEISEVKNFVGNKTNNFRHLCKMARAWKNKHGVGMGGLLIDTLAHKFLNSRPDYDNKSYSFYGKITRDFLKYLSEEPNKDYYLALGSNQKVKVRSKFQRKAKKAYNLSVKAIDAGEADSANEKWKKVYGRSFPAANMAVQESKSSRKYNDTEQFIEDLYPIDIRFNIKIDCEVHRNQGMRQSLLTMISNGFGISSNKKLIFKLVENNVVEPFDIKWKILNKGTVAESRDCIRGDIIDSNDGLDKRKETADFSGEHVAECYIIKHGVVVAKDDIKVPIL
jgi:hypothetical protein